MVGDWSWRNGGDGVDGEEDWKRESKGYKIEVRWEMYGSSGRYGGAERR